MTDDYSFGRPAERAAAGQIDLKAPAMDAGQPQDVSRAPAGRRHVSPETADDKLLEAAWGLIANAGWDAHTGDVSGEKSPGWHEAAVRFRDRYHARLSQDLMTQVAPYPHELADLVDKLRYRRHMGWKVRLEDDWVRDPADTHAGESRGLTLIVTRNGPNSYKPEQSMKVAHAFAVPPATYNRESWMEWLFARLADVDTHERMEDFAFVPLHATPEGERLERPKAPVHAPGFDPYMVTAVPVTDEARRTSFRGEVNPA